MFKNIVFSLSVFFFSLSFFSVRAMALSYILLGVLFVRSHIDRLLLRMPRRVILSVLLVNFFVIFVSFRHGIYLNYLLKFIGMSIYVVAISMLTRRGVLDEDSYVFACKVFISIHSFFFLVQLLSYIFFGSYIDFDSYIREAGSISLHETKSLEGFYVKIRAGGLFSEPSFYSMTVLPMSMLLAIHLRSVPVVVVVGFLTSLLTFSIAAMGIVSLAYVLVVYRADAKKYLVAAGVIAFVVAAPMLLEIFRLRVIESIDYNAVDSRMAVFREFEVRGLLNNLFGSGFLWDERALIGRTWLEGYQVRDSSFFVYLFYTAGWVGVFLFFVSMICIFRRNFIYFWAVCIVLLFKFHVMTGMLWVVYVFAIYFSGSRTLDYSKHL